jgi:hypothetical protein
MFSRRKYNFYKLLVLYWAQSPHSNGALLLYRHVIQKPIMKASDQEKKEEEEDQKQHISFQKGRYVVESYRILDGYNPPNLASSGTGIVENQTDGNNSVSSHGSSSSSEDDSERLKYHQEDHQPISTLSIEKEVHKLNLILKSK